MISQLGIISGENEKDILPAGELVIIDTDHIYRETDLEPTEIISQTIHFRAYEERYQEEKKKEQETKEEQER